MKKLLITLASLLMLMGLTTNIYAAELNQNEAEIIQEISGDNAKVKIEDKYVNQLKNYFYQDGVDIGQENSIDFVKALETAVEKFDKLSDGIEFNEFTEAYISLEKAMTLIDIHVEYDSSVNGFYGIDYLGQIVIDPQPIIKDTDEADTSWNISIEIIFAIAVVLCILGLLANVRRWNRKMKHRNEKKYEEDEEDEDELEVADRKSRRARIKTMSYRSIQQILKYFYIPAIMAIVVVVIGFGLATINSDFRDSISRSFINTQPVYSQLTDEFVPTDVAENEQPDTVSAEEFNWPVYGEKYGVLQCEKLQVEAPVYWGDRGNVLATGAGTYIGSSIPGLNSTILIGAHDTTYFKGLENVAVNDEFIFTTEYGVYRYKVTDIKICEEGSYDDGYNLASNSEKLVLYTCYPFGELNGEKTERMFVCLDKVNGPSVN